jgi:hypothetical protein
MITLEDDMIEMTTTTAGAGTVVVEDCVECKDQPRPRWHKLSAFVLSTLVLLVGAIVAIKTQPDSAAMIFAALAGAAVSAFGVFVTGNVKEHGVKSLLGKADK